MNDFIETLTSRLTEHERRCAVVYAAEKQIPAGTQIEFPGTQIKFPTDSFLGFIDGEPEANWGHKARYVVMSLEGSDYQSVEVRLPPFKCGVDISWRIVYQAESVPKTAVQHNINAEGDCRKEEFKCPEKSVTK